MAGLAGQTVPQNPAGDWPQWRGPDRTGLSRETGLLNTWPAGGPRVVWSVATLGPGQGTVAVKGDRVFVQGSDPLQSTIVALNRADGKTVWTQALGKSIFAPSGGAGPRATPTIDGDRVYALTENGDLACLRARDGSIVWKRTLIWEFKGKLPTWLFAESPLIDGDRIYVTPGGQGAGIVALDKMTGETVWMTETLGGEAAYGSIVVGDIQGVRTLLAMTVPGGVGVRASDGKVMWKDPRLATSAAHVATPNFFDGKVLYAYDSGLSLLSLTAERGSVTARPIYFSTDLAVEWGGVVIRDGYAYAFNAAGLVCVEVASGKRVWRDRSIGTGALTYADGHLYLLSKDFVVGLAEATPAGYKETGRFTIAETAQPSYAHPVVSGGRLYIRNQGNLTAYDIKAK
jgi:outer membrane protein assembly factor BamB